MKKLNKGKIMGIGLGVLAVAQFVLGNKKEDIDQKEFKTEVIDEVMKKISDNK